MLILTPFVIGLVSLIAIAIVGGRRLKDRDTSSFRLVIVLLLIAPLPWIRFQVSVASSFWIIINVGFVFVVSFLLFERDNLGDFYLTQKGLLPSLLDGLLVSLVLIVPSVALLVYWRTGQVSWFPREQVSTYLVQYFQVALFEELVFRSLFLGYLRRFLFSPFWAIVIQAVFFWSMHLGEGDYLQLGFVAFFGLLAGYMTSRRGSVAGAILAHLVANFALWLFVGGKNLGL